MQNGGSAEAYYWVQDLGLGFTIYTVGFRMCGVSSKRIFRVYEVVYGDTKGFVGAVGFPKFGFISGRPQNKD